MKCTALLFWLFIPFVLCAQEKGETILSLNGDWKFKTDPNDRGEAGNWFAPALNDANWDTMEVPGNWDLRNEYAHYAGKAWYRKTFTTNFLAEAKPVRLLFEAVSGGSKVWVNGKYLGDNNSSFLPFQFFVNSFLNKAGKNTLVVRVDNSFRVGAPWNWGGIRRPVTLVATNPVYIERLHISPSLSLADRKAVITVGVNVVNTGKQATNVEGEVQIQLPSGTSLNLPFSAVLPSQTTREVFVSATLLKEQVHLWSFDDPYLYNCKVSIKSKNAVIHEKSDRFGLRKVEVDAKNGTFKLNGESVRLMGFNLVPDDRTTGNTLPLWRIKEDIDMMRSAGANMARLAHFPFHKELLDYLDERGMLIIEEIPVWGYSTLVDAKNPVPIEWLHRLVTGHYNHPSIIGWSVGNEIGQVPGAMAYVEAAIKFVRTLDTTRLVNVVSHTADRDKDIIDYSDFGLVNKYGTGIGMLADKMHQLHPQKLLFYSEYGYNQIEENLNADIDAKGMMDSLRFKPFLVGGAIWTWNDYRSSYVGTKEFSENRPWGVVNVFRQKKKAYHSLRKEYAPVKQMEVRTTKEGNPPTSYVTIHPRTLLDLPAYSLKGYLLVWKGYNEKGQIVEGGFQQLPVINPGDQQMEKRLQWKRYQDLSSVQFSLISPLSYSVYDTILLIKQLEPPTIRYANGVRMQYDYISPDKGAIRIVVEPQNPDTDYKVRYGKEGLTSETTPTRNHFIDIPNLAVDETYTVAVTGISNGVESKASQSEKIKIGTGLPPPVIYYTEPADKGFFVGYATMNIDYLFQLQYSTIAGDYSKARAVQSTTKGVLFVPDLVNGKRYFFRMKAVKHNNYHTEWSEEHTVVPDGNQLPEPPALQGILRNGKEALLCFEPVKKAIGYVVEYKEPSATRWLTKNVTAAQIAHFLVDGLSEQKTYNFRMATVNQYGQSKFTDSISK
jgi:beta-galactosidase